MKLPVLAKKKQTLKKKLFKYMCILAASLCAFVLAGSFLIGNFTGTKQRIADTLEFQLQIFEKQIDTYYDNLAVMSVQLSNEATEILESYLVRNSIDFSDLNDDEALISGIQDALITPLRYKLWEADCSGAFIVLDAKVNSKIEGAEYSRTGIYLQRNSLETTDTRVLLYRGLSDVGKRHNCMPHRKWRLEFNTKLFPNYDELKSEASFPLYQSYRITDVALLPGTDQHVMLMTVPLLSKDGTFYGLCGFELNEGYFKQIFAQPSELERAVFCISKSSDGLNLSESTTLSAGILNNYYLEPHGSFGSKDFGSGLIEYSNENASYIGITNEIRICPSKCTSAVSVLIPKQDYNQMRSADTLRIILLIASLSATAVILAWFFSRRYLQPLKQSLDIIRKKEYEQSSADVVEINDLFDFLAEQDRINEDELSRARREKDDALAVADEFKSKFDETSKQNERLAYSRKDEIDPYDYENFKVGIQTLTKKEHEIFELYLSGKTAKDILSILQIQESTLKFHNHNILEKLGVSSRKQMLRFAALMQQENQ